MPNNGNGRVARVAAAAGLGLTLALGAAPVAALATEGATVAGDAVTGADSAQEQAFEIKDEKDFETALEEHSENAVWNLSADIQLGKMLNLSGLKNVTINGNGHTITAGTGFAWNEGNQNACHLVQVLSSTGVTLENVDLVATSANKHVLNVYGESSVTLSNVTLDHSAARKGAPLVVNASSVTADGPLTLVTGENSWYAANVDSRYGEASFSVDPSASADLAMVGPMASGGVVAENTSSKGDSVNNNKATVNLGDGTTVTATDANQKPAKLVVAKTEDASFSTIQEAVDAAELKGGSQTVTVLRSVPIERAISVDGDITVTAAEGVTLRALSNAQGSFVLSGGAKLDGLKVMVDDVSAETNIVQMNTGTSVANCEFVGSFDVSADDSQTVRAIVGVSGATGLSITGNTFTNLRQPGYINNCTGTISDNTVTGTRGWVVCGNSNMEITGEKFSGNAVDIAIIPNSPDATNNYAKKAAQLSSANSGAYVQDQLAAVEAEDGAIVVGRQADSATYTLQAALDGAAEGDTVRLLSDVTVDGAVSVPAGVTLDGNRCSLTLSANLERGAFVTAGKDANNVTIKNITVNTNGYAKHGVQFYCNEGGELQGVTVNGGSSTAVQVNGATGVTITGCDLNPAKSAYANIEYGMGSGVTTIPSVTVDDVSFADGVTQLWADKNTVSAIKGALGNGASEQDAVDKIAQSVTNKGESDLTVSVGTSDGGSQQVVVEGDPAPVVPPAQSGEKVTVSETDGGTVKVSPERAKKGETVTVTATPDEGQEVRSVSVVDADGKSVEVRAGEKDGEYVFTMPDGAVTVTVAFGCDGGELCPTHGFNDVDQSAWYHDAVDWAVENGVLNGYGEGGRVPRAPWADVTRAEMAQMLWNRAGRRGRGRPVRGSPTSRPTAGTPRRSSGASPRASSPATADTFGTERTISREGGRDGPLAPLRQPRGRRRPLRLRRRLQRVRLRGRRRRVGRLDRRPHRQGRRGSRPAGGLHRGEVAAMMMRMAE